MSETVEGGCACGRIRYAVRIENDHAYLCHCRMCQRAIGSVSIAFKGVKRDDVRWQRESDWFDSSPIAKRPYCRDWGTSLGFQFNDDGEGMDLTVASFDDPARFKPTHHFGAESIHRACLNTDGLPETRTDEYPKLVDKWNEATGNLPQ